MVVTATPEMFQPELESLLQMLAQSREWVIEPPALFDLASKDDKEAPQEATSSDVNDPESDDALGGCVDLYSAIQGPPLPYAVDARQFEEVTALVHLLERFSIKHGLDIKFYLDSEQIGKIVWGLQDESLRVGLLEEWKHILEDKKKGVQQE